MAYCGGCPFPKMMKQAKDGCHSDAIMVGLETSFDVVSCTLSTIFTLGGVEIVTDGEFLFAVVKAFV